MKQIIIDSCVFFKMIKYNDIYCEKGLDELIKYITVQSEYLESIEKRLDEIFSKDFKEKYAHLTFDEKVEKYKEYASGIITSAEKKIVSHEKNAQGIFYDKGKEFKIDIPEERKQKFLSMAEEQRNLYNLYQPTYDEYMQLKEKYKNEKLKLQAGLILLKSIYGEVDLHITSTIYDEIRNHIGEEEKEQGNIVCTETQVSNMTKHCTLINTHSEKIVDLVKELSKQYRTEPLKNNTKKYKQMDMDQNSLGLFGDSSIMAETSLAGINIITENEQDYIKDTGTKQKNDKIRNYISYINELYKPVTSSALAFSSTEFLEGGYKEVERQSETITFVEIAEQEKNPEFKNEVYMEIK